MKAVASVGRSKSGKPKKKQNSACHFCDHAARRPGRQKTALLVACTASNCRKVFCSRPSCMKKLPAHYGVATWDQFCKWRNEVEAGVAEFICPHCTDESSCLGPQCKKRWNKRMQRGDEDDVPTPGGSVSQSSSGPRRKGSKGNRGSVLDGRGKQQLLQHQHAAAHRRVMMLTHMADGSDDDDRVVSGDRVVPGGGGGAAAFIPVLSTMANDGTGPAFIPPSSFTLDGTGPPHPLLMQQQKATAAAAAPWVIPDFTVAGGPATFFDVVAASATATRKRRSRGEGSAADRRRLNLPRSAEKKKRRHHHHLQHSHPRSSSAMQLGRSGRPRAVGAARSATAPGFRSTGPLERISSMDTARTSEGEEGEEDAVAMQDEDSDEAGSGGQQGEQGGGDDDDDDVVMAAAAAVRPPRPPPLTISTVGRQGGHSPLSSLEAEESPMRQFRFSLRDDALSSVRGNHTPADAAYDVVKLTPTFRHAAEDAAAGGSPEKAGDLASTASGSTVFSEGTDVRGSLSSTVDEDEEVDDDDDDDDDDHVDEAVASSNTAGAAATAAAANSHHSAPPASAAAAAAATGDTSSVMSTALPRHPDIPDTASEEYSAFVSSLFAGSSATDAPHNGLAHLLSPTSSAASSSLAAAHRQRGAARVGKQPTSAQQTPSRPGDAGGPPSVGLLGSGVKQTPRIRREMMPVSISPAASPSNAALLYAIAARQELQRRQQQLHRFHQQQHQAKYQAGQRSKHFDFVKSTTSSAGLAGGVNATTTTTIMTTTTLTPAPAASSSGEPAVPQPQPQPQFSKSAPLVLSAHKPAAQPSPNSKRGNPPA